MAEREGFEPPIPVKVCPLSRRIVSTTHAPLRAVKRGLLTILSGAAHQELPQCVQFDLHRAALCIGAAIDAAGPPLGPPSWPGGPEGSRPAGR
jgi:hypothetical protein